MQQVLDFFSNIFSADNFPARWHCGKWTSFHGWLYIISSVSIGLAYFSIPILLLYIIKKSKNQLPFQKVFWLFLFFILACGFTHLFDAAMFWFPVYRATAFVLFITAIVSWLALYGLYKVIPTALALKSPVILENTIRERTEELRYTNEFLTRSNLELKESKAATEKLVKQKDDFLNIASHELKTPVTSLKAYTQILLLQENENDDKKNMYAKMNAQVDKLTVLINDLLDTTKLQGGVLNYNKEKMSLSNTVAEAVEEMQRTNRSHTITLKENVPLYIMGDKEKIISVINNFLSNAIKYSPGNNQVIVQLSRENNNAVFSVRDFGIGIPGDQQGSIFQKFYRVTSENSHTFPGMGLGLYIVKDIITRHSGRVWLESEEGSGSTFYFSLPVV